MPTETETTITISPGILDQLDEQVETPWVVILYNCDCHSYEEVIFQVQRATGCTLEKNGSLGMGTNGTTGLTITKNTFRLNSATGVVYNTGTTNVNHSGNLSYQNYTRLGAKIRTPFTQTGWSTKIERDILMRNGATPTIGTNNYQ